MIWRFKFYSEFYSAAWTLRNRYRGLATVNDLFTPGPTPAQRRRLRCSSKRHHASLFGVVHSHIWCCTLPYLVLYTLIFGVVHSHIWCFCTLSYLVLFVCRTGAHISICPSPCQLKSGKQKGAQMRMIAARNSIFVHETSQLSETL